MNTLYLRYAVEIEKTRSITQAAENLYMAQPNLSKAMKELETSLGITIFRRTSKGVIPTEQGIKFLNCAKQILVQIDAMEAIGFPEKQRERRMRISVPRTGYISKAFSEYIACSDSSDDMKVFFCETSSLKTIENVRENGYNFGIIRFNSRHEKYFSDFLSEKNLDSRTVRNFSANAVMSAEHPFANLEQVSYAKLSANCPELVQGDEGIPYVPEAVERLFCENRNADSKVRRIYTFDRGSAIDFLVTVPDSFMLDSPVPESLCLKHGLVQKKCVFPDNSFSDVLIYPVGKKFSKTELSLLERFFSSARTQDVADILDSL